MNTLSFMSANFVARQLNYKMPAIDQGGWGYADGVTNQYFSPIETFAERFDAMLEEVAVLGFKAIDLWTGHLNPLWADEDHVAIARELLSKHALSVSSLAGGFGSTQAELARSCQVALGVGAKILGGNAGLLYSDRASAIDILREYGVQLGIENHPEKNSQELLAKIGEDAPDVIGACVDTGWFGTHGYDAAQALHELSATLVHIHLKDVLAAGGHHTCRFGAGCVPIEGCVRALQRLGYSGGISIEHEPEEFDPRPDCQAGLAMVKGWLASSPSDLVVVG